MENSASIKVENVSEAPSHGLSQDSDGTGVSRRKAGMCLGRQGLQRVIRRNTCLHRHCGQFESLREESSDCDDVPKISRRRVLPRWLQVGVDPMDFCLAVVFLGWLEPLRRRLQRLGGTWSV